MSVHFITALTALSLAASACADIGPSDPLDIGGDGDDDDDDGDTGGGAGGPDGGSGGGGSDDVGDDDDEGPAPVALDVSGTAQWTDTGLDLALGDHVLVNAAGLVAHGGGGEYGPGGDPALSNFSANVVNCVGHVALIGRVGALGDPFYVGPSTSFAATTADRLYLGINDVGLDNNAGAFDTEITAGVSYAPVDSRTVSVSGTAAWTDTGVDVAAGQQLTVTASGTVIHDVAGNNGCDPAGEPATANHGANVIACSNHASLIARIGPAGAPFPAGRLQSAPVAASGRVYLGVNDSDVANNSGSYTARVVITDP